eukprot:6121603-Alexandrium_andersonii.AAC.1
MGTKCDTVVVGSLGPGGRCPVGSTRSLLRGLVSGGDFLGLRRVSLAGCLDSRRPAVIRSGRVELRNCILELGPRWDAGNLRQVAAAEP